MSQEALASLFSEHNLSYQSLSIPVRKFGPFKGKSRGFAFANVENEEAQKKVIEALDGKEVTGAGSNETAAAPAEGEAASGPRKFKLVVRQGYEADLKQPENEGEEGGAGAAGEWFMKGVRGALENGVYITPLSSSLCNYRDRT
ncbi:hypothetical protein EMMF5_001708 [Cystobasidiomycetes sp. EMM_F5]